MKYGLSKALLLSSILFVSTISYCSAFEDQVQSFCEKTGLTVGLAIADTFLRSAAGDLAIEAFKQNVILKLTKDEIQQIRSEIENHTLFSGFSTRDWTSGELKKGRALVHYLHDKLRRVPSWMHKDIVDDCANALVHEIDLRIVLSRLAPLAPLSYNFLRVVPGLVGEGIVHLKNKTMLNLCKLRLALTN